MTQYETLEEDDNRKKIAIATPNPSSFPSKISASSLSSDL
jgi:hypothetical protein